MVGSLIAIVGLERMSYRWELMLESEAPGSGRSVFWRYAFEQWYGGDLVTIFFGRGLIASREVLDRIYGDIWCHNDFLEILLCQGILGLILYLWLLVSIARIIWPYADPVDGSRAGVALFVAFVVCAGLSGTIYQLDAMMVFCASVALIGIHTSRISARHRSPAM
jgi:hypothetical protein